MQGYENTIQYWLTKTFHFSKCVAAENLTKVDLSLWQRTKYTFSPDVHDSYLIADRDSCYYHGHVVYKDNFKTEIIILYNVIEQKANLGLQ